MIADTHAHPLAPPQPRQFGHRAGSAKAVYPCAGR
jgi:hypothetical protein